MAKHRTLSEANGQKGNNPQIFPIPGATTDKRVLENSRVVKLSDDEFAELESLLKKFEPAGERYPAQAAGLLDA